MKQASRGAGVAAHRAPSTVAWVRALLDWFAVHRRPMPWRDNPQPYMVWISEMMLQQTQVVTVGPYFARFMRRFPTVEALAGAPLEAVLRCWQGLGYYARARHLHEAARRVVAELDGRLPTSAEGLRALPGIGPYSAAAIASIAFGEAVPAVDGNVVRVFARFWKLTDDSTRPAFREQLAARLADCQDRAAPGDFNQAVMELGALVCRPRQPDCAACPLLRWCQARAAGVAADLPVKPARKAVPHQHFAVAVVVRDGRVLVARRPATGLLGGLWEFPGGPVAAGESWPDAVVRVATATTGLDVAVEAPLEAVRHAFSHLEHTLHPFLCRCRSGRLRAPPGTLLRWSTPRALDRRPWSAAMLRIVRAVQVAGSAPLLLTRN